MTLKQFEVQTNLNKKEAWILKYSFVNPEYFKIGEKLLNGSTVTTDNTILKSLNLRIVGKIEELGDFVMAENEYRSGSYHGPQNNYDGWADLGKQEEDNMDRETGGWWRWNID